MPRIQFVVTTHSSYILNSISNAKAYDLENICKCTYNAYKDFTIYYKNQNLYDVDSRCRVLIAVVNNEVVGTLIVNIETEGKGLGSLG